ncbi:hypothetical protein IAF49_17825 [Acinetobacter baumannii]|nr:hypothetical protein [Acinetobacter baumannii]
MLAHLFGYDSRHLTVLHLHLHVNIDAHSHAIVIQNYQQQHPEHASRYQLFDVFAEKLRIESLTKRRLFGDRSIQIKFVDNPLAPFKLQVK